MRATPDMVAKARDLARDDFLAFVITVWPSYEFSAHNVYLIDKLNEMAHGRLTRQMTFMPPRHGKSLVHTRLFPAFVLGREPDEEVMIASYGADLAYDFSRSVRGILGMPTYPFQIKIKRGRASVKTFGVEGHEGGLVAAGIGGPLTGRGAKTLLLDDVVKDRQDADSVVKRQRAEEWYADVARTRLAPSGRIGFTLTRWHEGDLAGVQLEAMRLGGEQWDITCMPALAYGDGEAPWYAAGPDPIGRKPGEALWPERFSREHLLALRDGGAMSMRSWLALFQQNTTATAGNVYKREWFEHRWRELPPTGLARCTITVDAAYVDGVGTSFSAMQAGARTAGELYVLDAWRGRVEFDDLVMAVVDFWGSVKNKFGMLPTVSIENKASGASLIQTLHRNFPHIPVVPFPEKGVEFQKKLATTSKEARADSATPPYRMGKVLLPREAWWITEFINEHCNFPTALNSDWVDTTSMLVAILWSEVAAAAAGEMISREELLSGRTSLSGGYNAKRGGRFDPLGRSGYNASRSRAVDQ